MQTMLIEFFVNLKPLNSISVNWIGLIVICSVKKLKIDESVFQELLFKVESLIDFF